MGSEWKPDDRFLDEKRRGGVQRVDAAFKRPDRIVTSRDEGMDDIRYRLRRENMPPGWDTWQLPVYLMSEATFFFLTSSAPGAILPSHAHKVAQFRMVLSGGLLYNGIELRSGDWIYIPPEAEYSLSASMNPGGCVHMYAY